MRVSLPSSFDAYIKAVGEQIGEGDPTRIVIFILQDHRRGSQCAFAASGPPPIALPLPSASQEDLQTLPDEALAADLASMWSV